MSATIYGQMNQTSPTGLLAGLRAALDTWRRRNWERGALAALDDRDLHDLGLSRAAANYESGKPFWRA